MNFKYFTLKSVLAIALCMVLLAGAPNIIWEIFKSPPNIQELGTIQTQLDREFDLNFSINPTKEILLLSIQNLDTGLDYVVDLRC